MSVEQRLALIEERHANLAEHVTQLSTMMTQLEKVQEKTDKRINRLFEITLRIGADFAERLRKLEEDEGSGEEPTSQES
jgi:uncharacterized coiled-coil protein SlyX